MVTKKYCLLNKSFYSSDAQVVKVVNTSARSAHDFEHFSPEMDRPTYEDLTTYSGTLHVQRVWQQSWVVDVRQYLTS